MKGESIKPTANPSFLPTPNYHTTPSPIVSSTPIALTSPKYQSPHPISIVKTTHAPQYDSEEYQDNGYYPSSTPSPQNPTKILYQSAVTTLSPISHNEIKPTTFSPSNYFNYKFVKIKDSQRYSLPTSSESPEYPSSSPPAEPKKLVTTKLKPINVPDQVSTQKPFAESTEDVPEPLVQKPLPLVDLRINSLSEILEKLQQTNHLPKTLTADNIDNSIKTLVKILGKLKQTQEPLEIPEQNHQAVAQEDYDYHGEYDNFNAGEIQNGI